MPTPPQHHAPEFLDTPGQNPRELRGLIHTHPLFRVALVRRPIPGGTV